MMCLLNQILKLNIKRRTKKTKEELYKEVKKKLEDSIIRNDIEYEFIKTKDMNQCITSIKMIQATIKTYNKKVLGSFCEIGKVLRRMQEMNYSNFMDHLKNNDILYSKATVYLYIKLSKLADKYPIVKYLSVSFYFVNINFKIIKELCKRGDINK